MNTKDRHELIRAILMGVAVGDALGFPAQFEPRIERKLCPVVGMGQYRDEEGMIQSWGEGYTGLWSDDTSLTLCLAESLTRGFDLKDQAERFVAWLDKGHLSAWESAFDVGIQTSRSLAGVRKILRSGDPEQLAELANDSDPITNGNGSLMRILPLVLHIRGKRPEEQFNLARQSSALTHPHVRSALCCFLYLRMAEHIIGGKDKSRAYELASGETRTMMERLACPEEEFAAMNRLLGGELGSLDEAEIYSGGYVVSSLEASIWCLLTTDSFAEAVLTAVNLGETPARGDGGGSVTRPV